MIRHSTAELSAAKLRLMTMRLPLLPVLLAPLFVACGMDLGVTGETSTPRSAFTAVWHGPDGQPAERGEGSDRSFEVAASKGPPHCNWETAVFLSVGWPLGTSPETAEDMRQYLRDPDGHVSDERLLGELDFDVEMPPDAIFSGYATEEVELWFGPDGGNSSAYLKTQDGTERWPRAEEPVACR